MDFDDAKENIQPLAAGRNASILQAALQADSQQELQQQRVMCEESIKNYDGEDPLEPWFEYIYWIEQSFPSGGKESGLEEVLLKCLTKFEKDERYHQDRRMIKLYIKYIDTHENPQECYQQLYNQGIGTMVSDLYICWAYYYDLSGNFRKADQIFRRGIDCHAEPFDELQEAHQHFGFTMSQRILYDDDNSKQKYQSTLQEKRQALTSLKSHKQKVGSVRTGKAIKSHGPGKIQLNLANLAGASQNSSVCILADENQDPNAFPPPETSAVTSKSVVKTILDSARKQENVKEPGPWNKTHDKKKGKLFASETSRDLGFEILVDEEFTPPIKSFVYFDGFVARNKPQEDWNLPVTLANELVPRSYPSYDKCLLYPKPNEEYSPEELNSYYWCKRKNIENNFTKKYNKIWKPNFDAGVRMYPNFAKKSHNASEEPISNNFDPLEGNVVGKSKLVFAVQTCYPQNEEELQFEEIMFNRWKNGDRKLKYGGNETIAVLEEMEETICMPKEADRRKSFYPRKSLTPSQLAILSRNQEEVQVCETEKISTLQRSILKKPTSKVADDEPADLFYPTQTKEYVDNVAFAFKTPAAPIVKQQKLSFQIYEEDENNYEANETCSTQVFNCFLKEQSVSTPKAPGKLIKSSSIERQPINFNLSGVENVPLPVAVNSNQIAALSPPEYIDAGLTLHGKQLSTIMETSEQATGHTASTKSSISSADFETEVHQSNIPLPNNICNLETVQEVGSLTDNVTGEMFLMKSLRFDDTVSTVPVKGQIKVFNLEQRDNTVSKMPVVGIFEDKTETGPSIIFEKDTNFSFLENREDTTPSIRPVKFIEDKTETITKIVPISKNLAVNEIPSDDEMMEFFAKSPEKVGSVFKNVCTTSPSVPTVNKSVFTASAFLNFRDSPEAKLKCDYGSPEMRLKCLSLTGENKEANLSIVPNFDDLIEVDDGRKKVGTDLSFLPNLYSISGSGKQQIPANYSVLMGPPIQLHGNLSRKQSKDDSFLQMSFKEAKDSSNALPRQRTNEDCFLSGFPSVTVGSNSAREDSFMSYLSNVGAPKGKQHTKNSIIKTFPPIMISNNEHSLKNAAGPTCHDKLNVSERINVSSSGKGEHFQKAEKSSKTISDSFKKCLQVTEGTRTLNLSGTALQTKKLMSNILASSKNQCQKGFGEKQNIQNCSSCSLQQATVGAVDGFIVDRLSTNYPPLNSNPPTDVSNHEKSVLREKQKDSPTKSLQKQNISFLTQKSLDMSKCSNRQAKISSVESKNSSTIPNLSQPDDISNDDKNASQMNQSQSFSTLSFPNSFSGKGISKQPDEASRFSIFVDSNSQKTNTIFNKKQENECNMSENFNCKSGAPYMQANKIMCPDISLKPDDFFEDNIRTEAFQANLSTIKNSTWLPNHDPHQLLKTEELAVNMANEVNTSAIVNVQKNHRLGVFASVPPNESFKSPKALLTISPQRDCIEIAESDDEEETDDLGKSIYCTKTPMTPKTVLHMWSPETEKSGIEKRRFIHRQVDLDQTQQLLDDYFVDKDFSPFNRELKDAFLCQIDFTNYIDKLSSCEMVRKIQRLKKDCTIEINGNRFNVLKLIGEGSFGAVYCAKEPESGRMFALKQERPANLWEYYICLELRSRLHITQILSGFINIEYALIGNNAGVLVSQFSRYGSLITVCNKIKKETLKNVDEYVVMHLASQLLLIMDHLHASDIIHADVKPDNFLLMEKLVPGRKQPTIQLIDFGSSIDMSLFKKGQTFRFIHENEGFKCVEMHEKRPWTYQLDLFGLAGVIHVLLFGKYMDIVKKVGAGWTHKTHIPRYFNKSLWETIFHSLLNIDDCQTMPNLQNLRAQLEEEIAEHDKSVCQKIVEFNRALDL